MEPLRWKVREGSGDGVRDGGRTKIEGDMVEEERGKRGRGEVEWDIMEGEGGSEEREGVRGK